MLFRFSFLIVRLFTLLKFSIDIQLHINSVSVNKTCPKLTINFCQLKVNGVMSTCDQEQ